MPSKTSEKKDFNEPIDVLLLTTDDVEFSAAYKILCNSKFQYSGEQQGQLCFGEIGRNKFALLKSSETTTGAGLRTHALCVETIQKTQTQSYCCSWSV